MSELKKIISNCPLCEEHSLHVIGSETEKMQQCISCGYVTSSKFKGTKEDNEEYKNLTDDMKKWSKETLGSIWIPSIFTLPDSLIYPDDINELEGQLETFLSIPNVSEKEPQIIVAPHAGYIYSGPIAGTAYRPLIEIKNQVETVVIFSPAHRYHVKGIATHSSDGFMTPFGPLTIDDSLRKLLLNNFNEIQIVDRAFGMEHGLEVHLPFVWKVFGKLLDNFRKIVDRFWHAFGRF